LSQTINELN